MKMDNIEFARQLAQVQDELGTLHGYLERNSCSVECVAMF